MQRKEVYPDIEKVISKYSNNAIDLNVTGFKDRGIISDYTNNSNKIANLFSITIYPCAASLNIGESLYLFTNLSKIKKTKTKTKKKNLSTTEYCQIIFDLMKNQDYKTLENLFYAKMASQQNSSFRNALKDEEVKSNLEVIGGKSIKTYISPGSIDTYQELSEKIKSLIKIGSRVKLLISNIQNNSKAAEITEKANSLFSDTDWMETLTEIDKVEFVNNDFISSRQKEFIINNELFNAPVGLNDLIKKDLILELHAEILAKIFAKDSDINIGVSKNYCVLCGIIFSLEKENITTHGKYSLQQGLVEILKESVIDRFPLITQVRISSNKKEKISDEIKEDILELLGETMKYSGDSQVKPLGQTLDSHTPDSQIDTDNAFGQ